MPLVCKNNERLWHESGLPPTSEKTQSYSPLQGKFP